MFIENKEEYRNIPVSWLHLSTRAYNCLMRANIDTLYVLIECQEKLPKLRNMGTKSMSEIEDILQGISNNGFSITDTENRCTDNSAADFPCSEWDDMSTFPDTVLSRPATDLKIPIRIRNAFSIEGIKTIEQVLRLNQTDISHMSNLGQVSVQQLQEQIDLLRELGEDYFPVPDNVSIDATEAEQLACTRREIDIVTAKKLQEGYGLKTKWLSEWYNLCGQSIYNRLKKRRNRGNWLGKELLSEEYATINDMIDSKIFYAEKDERKYYLVNNRLDDCAFLIVSAEDIKCYFLADLEETLQARVRDANLHRLSEKELSTLASLGSVVSIMKEQYFKPKNTNLFRSLAAERQMSIDEYSRFLFGIPRCPSSGTISDERVIAFLQENTISGRTYIPSTNETRWIRSYIETSHYSMDEFIEFFGFKTKVPEVNLDFTAEDFNDVEDDMQCFDTEADGIAKIFANTPLLGSKVLSQEVLETIYQDSRACIGHLLNSSYEKPSKEEEMKITLAVINYAKGWDTEDESGFWRYITTSFGYGDESGKLRNLLCKCVLDALIQNRRWFVINESRNLYKATILVHALSTKRSWFHFLDFLFEFYKTNLGWEYMENDPMIARMTLALRNRMDDAEEIPYEDIEIGSHVYYFREGLIKLIVRRPKYATRFVASLLKRIHNLINHTVQPAVNYEELLCDEWMTNKIQGSTLGKRDSDTGHRAVAIDYTHIKPVYRLHDESEVRIQFPDVRLASSDFSSLTLVIYCDDHIIEQKTLSYYGNELGKTMSGFYVRLEDYMRRSGSKIFNPQIKIICDSDVIYDSEHMLYRKFLVFHNKIETDINDCERCGYSFYIPPHSIIEFDGADIGDIKENSYLKGYYANLQKDFSINIDGELVAIDNNRDSNDAHITITNNRSIADYIVNGEHYDVVTGQEVIRIISTGHENKNRYCLALNSKVMNLEELPHEASPFAIVYNLELGTLEMDEISLRLIDLDRNRLITQRKVKVIRSLSFKFDRPYYFSPEDFREARVKVSTDGETVKEYPIAMGETYVGVQYQEGQLRLSVPIIKVTDNNNQEWNGSNLYWIKDISQDRFLHVKSPAGITVNLLLDEHVIATDGQNSFAFGNAVYGFSNTADVSWVNVFLAISRNGLREQRYLLGKLAAKEQFVEPPKFKIDENTLSWNMGLGFVGDSAGQFVITIGAGSENEISYNLRLDTAIISEDFKFPVGEYKYSIFKQSRNLFATQQVELHTGSLLVGDVNELRFLKHDIQIDTITFEDSNTYSAVKIRPSYIDHIEYMGTQYCGSESRECPIYHGILFYISNGGKRHEYSYEDCCDEHGHQMYQVNPVKIVYINDHTLSITHDTGDPDDPGDGFYYYRYLDHDAMENKYQLTDREPTKFNRKNYYLTDLYSYTQKEG